MNQPSCLFCGAAGGRHLFDAQSIDGEDFHVHRCPGCRAVYLFPRPDEATLARAYSEEYYGEGDEKFSPLIERVLDGFRRMRARAVLARTEPGAAVLDIGCGNGRFLANVVAEGRRGYGLELPGKSLERARRIPGLELTEGKLTRETYPPEHFDMVTLWHVFEHLDRPAETLDILAEILKPGGYLALSLPNIDSWQAKAFGPDWFHLDPPRHLFFLGPEPLTEAVTRRGFTLVSRAFLSLEQNPFGFQQSILNRLLPDRDVLFEALKGRTGGGRDYSRGAILAQKLFYMSTFPFFAALAVLEAAFRAGGTMALVFRKMTKES